MNKEKKNTLELIEAVNTFFKVNSPELHRYEFPDFGTYKIGRIAIVRHPGGRYLNMDEAADREYLKLWKNDVGGILLRDIKRNTLSKYYEFSNGDLVGLLRRVDDDEDSDFVEYGLPCIKHGDFKYIFIRYRANDGTYMTRDVNDSYAIDEQQTSCYTETEDTDSVEVEEPKSFELF